MVYRITSRRLAQCLSIVAETSPDAFEYQSAVEDLRNVPWKSNAMRWSLAPPPQFDAREFHFFLSAAARDGLIEADDGDHLELALGHLSLEPWELRLTIKGWRFIENYDTTILGRWVGNVISNVPTIGTSVIAALIINHLIGR